MRRILRVNMSERTAVLESVPAQYSTLGGRALTSSIVASEVQPTCAPLGKRNKLVVAPGFLAGTLAPCSGRLSVGGKSPLTGTIKESNVGGTVAPKLARLGIAAVVVEGVPVGEHWTVLRITREGGALEEVPGLGGLGNYDACRLLRERHGKQVAVMSIGQAGEMRLPGASVAVTDLDGLPSRHAGRGGMGALMGAKGLKAIVVDDSGTQRVRAAAQEDFKSTARQFAEALRQGTGFLEQLRLWGTSGGIPNFNAFGTFPTKNFSAGSFEHVDKITGQSIVELSKSRGGGLHGCTPTCPIRCAISFHGADGNYLVSGMEYETVGMLGSNLLIDDADAIAEMNLLLNDYGLDTIETGAALGVVMESGRLEFGDKAGALALIREVARGSVGGRMIGSGCVTTGKLLGVKRVPAVKGQGIPAHVPQSNKIVGVTYCTSPMGADHTAGIMYDDTIHSPEGKVEKSRTMQILMAFVDSLGLCMFSRACPDFASHAARLMAAFLGTQYSEADLDLLGRRVLNTEHRFNRGAGFTSAHDRLPEFMTEVKIPPHDLLFDVPDDELDRLRESLAI